MHYVYILRSISHPDRTYVGSTADLKKRLGAHNAGHSVHTSKYLPWKIEFYCAFPRKRKAENFESYLKSAFWESIYIEASALIIRLPCFAFQATHGYAK